jgi:signal transduction histidine kinase
MNLAGTPCLETYQNSWGIFTHDLQSCFPTATALASLNGESYLSLVIRDFDGNILGNLGIIDVKPLPQDISTIQFILQLFANRVAAEMKRQTDEDKLIEANQELQRATRRKDEFLATMSHELRTPLNAILGLSEALKAEIFGNLNERQVKSIDTIERSGEHLLLLINDILDVSKISAGKLELDISTVAIAHLCDASVAFVRQQACEKQIELDLRLGLPLGTQIEVDERRMRQVLINLLSNAVKFTPAGGQITLAVNQRGEIGAGRIEIAVTDTGIGIPSHQQSQLFQPFVQLDSSLSRQHEGSGLGLTLVKQIVELHGGTVSLESEIGQGSCFTVKLPDTCVVEILATNLSMSRATLSSHPALEIEPISSATILLVEDNQANIETFSGYLIAKGYRMLIANNGLAAIELTQSQQPDLILMDIQMPEMNGIEAIKAIRQLPNCDKMPMIALTARSMVGEREKCLAAGASGYLAKPVKLRELHQAIQQFLT